MNNKRMILLFFLLIIIGCTPVQTENKDNTVLDKYKNELELLQIENERLVSELDTIADEKNELILEIKDFKEEYDMDIQGYRNNHQASLYEIDLYQESNNLLRKWLDDYLKLDFFALEIVEISANEYVQNDDGSGLEVYIIKDKVQFIDWSFFGSIGKAVYRYHMIDEVRYLLEIQSWYYKEPYNTQDADIDTEWYYIQDDVVMIYDSLEIFIVSKDTENNDKILNDIEILNEILLKEEIDW